MEGPCPHGPFSTLRSLAALPPHWGERYWASGPFRLWFHDASGESLDFSRQLFTLRGHMPYRICKTLEIENGHMLSRHPDKCRFPHGHSRRVEVIVESATLDSHGMVCDFKAIKEAVGDFLETFDHALCVNTEDPMYETLKAAYGERVIGFAATEPTTEVLAKTFFDTIREQLAEAANHPEARYPLRTGVRLVRVRVWETSSSWAEYEAD